MSCLAATTKSIILNNGLKMPMVGLGCYFGAKGDYTNEEVTQAVKDAVDIGYRAFDTAAVYGTEPAVGKGLREKIAAGKIKREDIFVTTKLNGASYQPESVRPALGKSLINLDLGYIDLYLVHYPFGYLAEDENTAVLGPDTVVDNTIDHLKTWNVLEECVREENVRSIGVSNFNARQVKNIVDNASIKPAINQVEIHPYLRNDLLVKYCQKLGVDMTAYTPLGQPHSSWAKDGWSSPLQEPVIKALAAKYNKGPGQIALKYQIQRNITLTSKSSSPKRLRENLDLFDFEMTEEEMDKISALDRNDRVNRFSPASTHKDYPFHEEF